MFGQPVRAGGDERFRRAERPPRQRQRVVVGRSQSITSSTSCSDKVIPAATGCRTPSIANCSSKYCTSVSSKVSTGLLAGGEGERIEHHECRHHLRDGCDRQRDRRPSGAEHPVVSHRAERAGAVLGIADRSGRRHRRRPLDLLGMNGPKWREQRERGIRIQPRAAPPAHRSPRSGGGGRRLGTRRGTGTGYPGSTVSHMMARVAVLALTVALGAAMTACAGPAAGRPTGSPRARPDGLCDHVGGGPDARAEQRPERVRARTGRSRSATPGCTRTTTTASTRCGSSPRRARSPAWRRSATTSSWNSSEPFTSRRRRVSGLRRLVRGRLPCRRFSHAPYETLPLSSQQMAGGYEVAVTSGTIEWPTASALDAGSSATTTIVATLTQGAVSLEQTTVVTVTGREPKT